MKRALLMASMVVASAAWADVDARFAKLRDNAEALAGLGPFLDKYVGECGGRFEGGPECERNAKNFREVANGKKFYMIITEDSVNQLSPGEIDQKNGTVVLNLTPFFPASNSAVTSGAPSRTDANGNPVMSFMPIKCTVPELSSPQALLRQVSMKSLRLAVVFTPQGTWTLPKKGGGKISGVKARIDGVLVTIGRTGEELGLYLAK